MNKTKAHNDKKESQTNGISWIPLLGAVSIMFTLSIYPNILVRTDGTVDRIASYLLIWSMSAGFIRGVGFIPRQQLLALLFSGPASIVALIFFVLQTRYF